MRKFKKQSGVTLIEVLVTLVIMSVALSGIAVVQVSSMQSATQVKYRSAAIAAAQSMLDNMRVARAGSSEAESLANLQSYIGSSTNLPSGPSQAYSDYNALTASIDASMENRSPEFSITVDNARNVTFNISWTQRADAEAGTVKKTYSVSSIL